jgi:hypothetical protein
MENAIRNAIIKFEQEFLGRGPDEVRAFVVRDLVVVRLKGVLTPAERQLAKTSSRRAATNCVSRSARSPEPKSWASLPTSMCNSASGSLSLRRIGRSNMERGSRRPLRLHYISFPY